MRPLFARASQRYESRFTTRGFRQAFAMTASLWLPLKRFITSEGFFEVFSLFGLLCSLAVLGLAMLR
jgi:hypothetical protein